MTEEIIERINVVNLKELEPKYLQLYSIDMIDLGPFFSRKIVILSFWSHIYCIKKDLEIYYFFT